MDHEAFGSHRGPGRATCCRTCGSASVGARDDAGYRTCLICGHDWLDGTNSVVGVEQSRVTGRWYVTEDGYRVPTIDHPSEQSALSAAERLRENLRLLPAR